MGASETRNDENQQYIVPPTVEFGEKRLLSSSSWYVSNLEVSVRSNLIYERRLKIYFKLRGIDRPIFNLKI